MGRYGHLTTNPSEDKHILSTKDYYQLRKLFLSFKGHSRTNW